MTTETEYGPPIAVNGKRPEWLFGSDLCMARSKMHRTWYLAGEARPAREWGWEPIDAIRLRADHPYYQSAEYKASVGDAESRFNSVKVNYSHGGLRVAGEFRPDVGTPVFDLRPAMTEAEMIAALEATGHTVTPPSVRGNVRSTVVPVWALDRAANMAGWDCWDAVHRDNDFLRDSIIAHAETITKHETPPDPLAGHREFLAGLMDATNYCRFSAKDVRSGAVDDSAIVAAMAYLRANKGRL